VLTSPGKGGAGGKITVPESLGRGGDGGTAALVGTGGATATAAADREAISFLASSSSFDSLATCRKNTKVSTSYPTSGTTRAGRNLRNHLIQTSHFIHRRTKSNQIDHMIHLKSHCYLVADFKLEQVFMFLVQYALYWKKEKKRQLQLLC
jgi:hypothetical protein